MVKKKMFILLPDGVGLRNFAYSDFAKVGQDAGFDITYWNNTPVILNDFGFKEIRIPKCKIHPLTDILKNVRKHIELAQFAKKTNDYVYYDYKFPLSYRNFKSAVKSSLSEILTFAFSSATGLKKIRRDIRNIQRKTDYYKECLSTLKKEKPAVVFCTNQRHVVAISPLLAAQDLGIPTATFIFSWDNLPKATMVVETDYYFVWSEFMREELFFYYPYIKKEQVFVTGTPQFECHFDKKLRIQKRDFFQEYGLDESKKYICFSGDDITTSPDDQEYLKDTANALLKLNSRGYNLGIIFRRCPVDFSDRYNDVLNNFSEVIAEIKPKWNVLGDSWASILPLPEDVSLLTNTIVHSELVVNLGSSMVFDFVAHDKPCGYFNYNQAIKKVPKWDIHKCYNYVHFRSMPSKKAVTFIDSSDLMAEKIENMLTSPNENVNYAKAWFKIINEHEPELASQRIWNSIAQITKDYA